MGQKVSKADSDADLYDVYEQLGRPPTISEYRTHGSYSVPTVARHYGGSFKTARAAVCDTDSSRQAQYTREQLCQEIRRVASIVGGEPSKDDYKEHCRIALSTITYRFDSWVAAKKEAGVYDGGLGWAKDTNQELIITDMRRADGEIEGPLTQVRYTTNGKYTAKTVKQYFKSWEAACQKADVSRPTMGPKDIPDIAVTVDINRVKDRIGYYPTKSQYNDLGTYTEGIAKSRFGSWMAALRAAGYEGKPQDGQRNPNWKDDPKHRNYTHANWKKNRPRAIKRDGEQCMAPGCEMSRQDHIDEYGADLTAHHIRRDHWPDDRAAFHQIENLITFCVSHHGEYEKQPAVCESLLEERKG